MTNEEFKRKLWQLKRLGWLALVGATLIAVGFSLRNNSGEPETISTFFGILFLMPAFVYLVLLTLWHWKGRYRGTHSDLWGAVLLLEVSGWFKIIYFFRHILSDAQQSGRYKDSSVNNEV